MGSNIIIETSEKLLPADWGPVDPDFSSGGRSVAGRRDTHARHTAPTVATAAPSNSGDSSDVASSDVGLSNTLENIILI